MKRKLYLKEDAQKRKKRFVLFLIFSCCNKSNKTEEEEKEEEFDAEGWYITNGLWHTVKVLCLNIQALAMVKQLREQKKIAISSTLACGQGNEARKSIKRDERERKTSFLFFFSTYFLKETKQLFLSLFKEFWGFC